MKNTLVLALLIVISLNAKADVTDTGIFEAINARLGYMENVALFKAQNHLPIEDIEREGIVIENAKMSAREKGLDPDCIEDFFRAQMAVAKAIQFRYRADLLSQPTVEKPQDLETQIRPRLLSLGDQIIEQLAAYLRAHHSFRQSQFADFDLAIKVRYVTDSDKQVLFKALQDVKLLPTD